MADEAWFWSKGGERLGPFGFAQLQQMVAAGIIGSDTFVIRQGDSDWIVATKVPGLVPGSSNSNPVKQLLGCAKCGGQVSDAAVTCLHCGEKQPKQKQLDGDADGGQCSSCGTFNLIGNGYGMNSTEKCRGCGLPVQNAYPNARAFYEMERVHRRGLGVAKRAGWGAVVLTGFLIMIPFVIFGPKHQAFAHGLFNTILILVFIGVVPYFAGKWVAMRLVRQRAVNTWRKDPSPFASLLVKEATVLNWLTIEGYSSGEFPSDRNSMDWSKQGDRSFLTKPELAKRSAKSNFPWGLVIPIILVLVSLYVIVSKNEKREFELGRKTGIEHVREAGKKGPLVRPGLKASDIELMIPTDPNASPQWNAGFSAGYMEELRQMYPQLK